MAHGKPLINGTVAAAATPGQGRRLVDLALDALLPPQCLSCGALVDSLGVLCAACWDKVAFPGPPQCAACGRPFEFDPGAGALCAACVRRRPVYRRARAVMVYGDISRRLILAFKYGDRTDAAPAFGRWLARAGKELIAEAEVIVPVPLHWTRLFSRLYNQAALLAHALGKQSGLPVACDLLVRRKPTPPQGRLSPSARRRNVRGAFAVRPSRRRRLEGRRVLLVDDVLTTGATAAACARTLLRAGAASVDVLTLARVVRPEV